MLEAHAERRQGLPRRFSREGGHPDERELDGVTRQLDLGALRSEREARELGAAFVDGRVGVGPHAVEAEHALESFAHGAARAHDVAGECGAGVAEEPAEVQSQIGIAGAARDLGPDAEHGVGGDAGVGVAQRGGGDADVGGERLEIGTGPDRPEEDEAGEGCSDAVRGPGHDDEE